MFVAVKLSNDIFYERVFFSFGANTIPLLVMFSRNTFLKTILDQVDW